MSKKFKFKSEKPKEKWKIFSCGDEISAGAIKNPHLELFGNHEIIVEGCMGVMEYTDTYLKLRLPKGVLTVCGTEFDIVTFEDTTITVKGNMTSLEFCV